jgi:AraC-like DNA-binding protein
MSLSSFKVAFREYFNSTPAAWLRQRRLDLSVHKLTSSDLPVGEVAFECGFEDPSHFIRVFKKKFGMTPLQYRVESQNA